MNLSRAFQTFTAMQQDLLILVPRSVKAITCPSSYDFCNVAYLHPFGEKRVDLCDDSISGERLSIEVLVKIMSYIINELTCKKVSLEEYQLCVPSKHQYNHVFPLTKINVKDYYTNLQQPYLGTSFQAVFLEPSDAGPGAKPDPC